MSPAFVPGSRPLLEIWGRVPGEPFFLGKRHNTNIKCYYLSGLFVCVGSFSEFYLGAARIRMTCEKYLKAGYYQSEFWGLETGFWILSSFSDNY